MTSTAGPLLLLDGASMWFRSYFGVPSSITAPDGRPVNALRGFLDGAGWAPDGAHRELDLDGAGTVRVKQVRLHTDLRQ